MLLSRRAKIIISLWMAIIFPATEVLAALPSREALIPPATLGQVEHSHSGLGPTVIHIQTLHGDYGVQKKIQALLTYLKKKCGDYLILVEGSAFKLQPEVIRFFPDDMKLTTEIADALAQKGLVKGVELFLLENPQIDAYGIENAKAYRANREAFKAVFHHRKKIDHFIGELDREVPFLISTFRNKEARNFLERFEHHEKGKTLPGDWFNVLEREARKHLLLDLRDPIYQIDWPMLVRFSKLKELEKKMNRRAFVKERTRFLRRVRPYLAHRLYRKIAHLLFFPLSTGPLSDPETELLFETMIASLPPGFSFGDYPHVQGFVGIRLLQSEIKGNRFFEEMTRMSDKIFEKFVRTQTEKKILAWLKDFWLLKKAFSLELMPGEDERLLKDRRNIFPEKMVRRLLDVTANESVRKPRLFSRKEMNFIFERVLEFYHGVKTRDRWMIENMVKRIKMARADKVVLVTGGFHTPSFGRYLKSRDYPYTLISPQITKINSESSRSNYLRALLQNTSVFYQKSTLETNFVSDLKRGRSYGVDTEWESALGVQAAKPILARHRLPEKQIERMLRLIDSRLRGQFTVKSSKRSELRVNEEKSGIPPEEEAQESLFLQSESKETGMGLGRRVDRKIGELGIVMGSAFAATGLSALLGFHEQATYFIKLFGEEAMGAIFHGMVVLSTGLAVYAFRRWRETSREIQLRVQLEKELVKSTNFEKVRADVMNALGEAGDLSTVLTNSLELLLRYFAVSLTLEIWLSNKKKSILELKVSASEGFPSDEKKTIFPLSVGKDIVGTFVMTGLELQGADRDQFQGLVEQITLAIRRKTVEQALEENQILHKTLIESLSHRIFYKDYQEEKDKGPSEVSSSSNAGKTGIYRSVNEAFARDLGRTPEGIIGKTDYELFPKHLAREHRESDRYVMKSHEPMTFKQEGIIMLDNQQQKRIVEVTKVPVMGDTGKVIGLVGIFTDITERVKAEEQLTESNLRLQYILETVPFAILMRDVSLNLQYANTKAKKFFGWDVLSTDAPLTKGFFSENPNLAGVYQNENTRVLKTGERVDEEQTLIFEGKNRIFHKIKQPLANLEGDIFGILEIYEDVTQEKEIAERSSNAEVWVATYRFARQMAHDLNNMLVSVIAVPELIETKLKQGESVQEELSQLKTTGDHMKEMVEQLLTQSQFGPRSSTLVHLSALVKDVLKISRSRFQKVKVETSHLDESGYVTGNATQLYQIFLNLIVNAAQAMKNGGVLNVSLSKMELERYVGYGVRPVDFKSGKYLQVTISDTGPGMSENSLRTIKDILQGNSDIPFTTKQDIPFTTKQRGEQKGHGLGFSIIREILKGHDGMIDLTSTEGKGSTFYIYLPLSKEASEKVLKSKSQLWEGEEKIWIIHEETKVRETLGKQLKDLGYRLMLFGSGKEALDFAQSHPEEKPDLVIYDMNVEEKIESEIQFFQALKNIFHEEDLKGILATREMTSQIMGSYKKSESWRNVSPFKLEKFIQAIRQELDKRKSFFSLDGTPGEGIRRILIIEDEEGIARLLKNIIQMHRVDIETEMAKDGGEAIGKIESTKPFDVVLLDIHIPDANSLELAQKIRRQDKERGTKTRIIVSSGITSAAGGLQEVTDGELPKPFTVEAVKKKLQEIDREITQPAGTSASGVKEAQGQKRSEIRSDAVTPSEVLTLPVRVLMKGPRQDMIPLRFEPYGSQFLIELLQEWLGRSVEAERAGFRPAKSNPIFGERKIVMTARFESWVKERLNVNGQSDSGRVLLDAVWAENFIKHPRVLYLLFGLLETLRSGSEAQEPLIAFVGDKPLIERKIREALRRKNNGLSAEEKMQTESFLKILEKLVKVIAREEVAPYVEMQENGIALLQSGRSTLSQIPNMVDFVLKPEGMNERDMPLVAFVIPALLRAAELIRGVKAAQHEEILEKYLSDIFPGVARQGKSYVIEFVRYVTEVLQNDQLIATQA